MLNESSNIVPQIDDETRQLARRLWDYHRLSRPGSLERADFVLALGSHDERVAHRAAELMLVNVAPILVTSGGSGKVTSGEWSVPEGERFAAIAVAHGVPKSSIIVERQASNTGENLTFSRELLAAAGLPTSSGILVTKPYMERRSYATAARQWPDVTWRVASPDVSFGEYPTPDVPERTMIELMVGDLQRIAAYPRLGFQIPQDIPDDVWRACTALVQKGFDRFALKSTG